MALESTKAILGEAVVKQGLKYLSTSPEKNLVNLARLGETIAREDAHKRYCRSWAAMLSDEDNNWRKLALLLLKDTSPAIRDRIAVNFFVNAGILSAAKRKEAQEKHGVHVPWAVLFDPTGKCNLRCKGCWAGEYDRTRDMDFATLDRILREAEDLGTRFFVVSGGEPTVRMDDLVKLAESHSESVFHVFTNGTLIDKEAARRFAEAGNMTFAISLEGMEGATDARRGKGVFRRIMGAMDNLKEAGVVFGFSATYTRENTEEVGSDEFVDLMVEKGCKIGWLFTYVPVGGEADLTYMATPEQRAFMVRQVRRWRESKPIFIADFWNDGEAVGGCIAGGRCYFHINASGDVEPCAFVHYSNVNIKDCNLVDALRSPLFLAYQRNQPFNDNHLRPCPIIDNPEALERMVEETGARSTQRNGVPASGLCRPLRPYASAWGSIADRIAAEMEGRDRAGVLRPTADAGAEGPGQ